MISYNAAVTNELWLRGGGNGLKQEPEGWEMEAFPDLLKVGASRLGGQVGLSGGALRLLVHPYYDDRILTEKYRSALGRLLESNTDRSTPIVVMEEAAKTETMRRSLLTVVPVKKQNRVYIVPTWMGSPEPVEGWSGLIRIFKKAGVERCLVGGQYLRFGQYEVHGNREELDRQLRSRNLNLFKVCGCVGGALDELASAGFEVEISNIALPDRRRTPIKGQGRRNHES